MSAQLCPTETTLRRSGGPAACQGPAKGPALLARLPAEARRDLRARMVTRRMTAGSLIVTQDEHADSLFILQRGRVRLVIYGENGREMTLATIGPGDVFGEVSALDGGARGVSAEALGDTVAFVLSRRQLFLHLEGYPTTAIILLSELTARRRREREQLANLALLDVRVRLARLLVRLAREGGDEAAAVIQRRPTQQELAHMVGSCRETVSRTLTGFKRRGLISARGRRLELTPALHDLAA